jgi:hypothetical protein
MAAKDITAEFVRRSAAVLAELDYGKMRAIAKEIHDDPALLADFELDPEGFVRARGFRIPEGMHIHIADAENKFFPPEEPGIFGDESKANWARIETRAGYKTFSLVCCN